MHIFKLRFSTTGRFIIWAYKKVVLTSTARVRHRMVKTEKMKTCLCLQWMSIKPN